MGTSVKVHVYQPRLSELSIAVSASLSTINIPLPALQYASEDLLLREDDNCVGRTSIDGTVAGFDSRMHIVALAGDKSYTLPPFECEPPLAELAIAIGTAAGKYWLRQVTSIQSSSLTIPRMLGTDPEQFEAYATFGTTQGFQVRPALFTYFEKDAHRAKLVGTAGAIPFVHVVGLIPLHSPEAVDAVRGYTKATARPNAHSYRTRCPGLFTRHPTQYLSP